MTIREKIKNKVLHFLGLEHLGSNPNSQRYTYINNIDDVNQEKLNEYKVWYVGDSDELLNYYTDRDIHGNVRNPIYNRNKPNYFWGINPKEHNIKRVHSGLPHVAVSTLCDVISNPDITNAEYQDKIDKIIENNDFDVMLNQQQRPLTLVEGWGAYKIIFDSNLSKTPILQYYEAEDVAFIYKKGVIVGIVYLDYYKYQDNDYVLVETRKIKDGNSYIEFELDRLDKSDTITKVPLDTIDELAFLPENGYCIHDFNEILGVPTKYFYDVNNKNYGRSVFCGKLDLFDDLDQSLSQRSQTCKKSTPIDYIPVDMLEKDNNSNPIMPDTYDRQFIAVSSYPNGDGLSNGNNIVTTQPQLNFDQYSQEQIELVKMILSGILSPATLGIDIAKKDNAEAQREKEKVTIMTRNNIIAMETKILKKLFSLCLCVQEYMDTGEIVTRNYDISVKYSEFANPTFENLSQILTPMWVQGAISTEMYVNKLYGDSLSDEEKLKEITWLDNERSKNDLEIGDFDNAGVDLTESE